MKLWMTAWNNNNNNNNNNKFINKIDIRKIYKDKKYRIMIILAKPIGSHYFG